MSAEELDEAMNDRRLELRLRWSTIARRAGMDPSNLRRIRLGDITLTDFAARGIDKALEWPAGKAAGLFARDSTSPDERTEAVADDAAARFELEQRLAAVKTLPEDERVPALDQIIAELEAMKAALLAREREHHSRHPAG